jgi:hypothetical protein
MQYCDEKPRNNRKRILMKIQRENVQSRNKNNVGAHRKCLYTKNQTIANNNNINLSKNAFQFRNGMLFIKVQDVQLVCAMLRSELDR